MTKIDTSTPAVAERVAHLRHVYGDTCPDAALIETLALGRDNALKAFSETVAENTRLNLRLVSLRAERDALCAEVARLTPDHSETIQFKGTINE